MGAMVGWNGSPDRGRKRVAAGWLPRGGWGAAGGRQAADVDGDGRDEIIYHAMVVDDDGRGLYTTGLRYHLPRGQTSVASQCLRDSQPHSRHR